MEKGKVKLITNDYANVLFFFYFLIVCFKERGSQMLRAEVVRLNDEESESNLRVVTSTNVLNPHTLTKQFTQYFFVLVDHSQIASCSTKQSNGVLKPVFVVSKDAKPHQL